MNKPDKTDIYFLLGTVLTLSTIYPIQKFISNYRGIFSITVVIIAIIIFLIWLIKKYYGIILVDKGLKFMKEEINICFDHGGTIISTAIFEDAKKDDITD